MSWADLTTRMLTSIEVSRIEGEDGQNLCVKLDPSQGLGAEICASRIRIVDVGRATSPGEPVGKG